MNDASHPTSRVAIYTHAGWITGLIHLHPGRTLLSEINEGGSFFRLTDVSLPLEEARRGFFAVLAREATMVLPLDAAELYAARTEPNGTMPHEVAILLQEGTMLGLIDVLEGCRVSDHLLNREGFLTVRDIRVPIMELPPGVIEPIPIGYLNSSRIIGLTETDAMRADAALDEPASIFSET